MTLQKLTPTCFGERNFYFGLLSNKKKVFHATYTLFPTYEEAASAQYKYYSQGNPKRNICRVKK